MHLVGFIIKKVPSVLEIKHGRMVVDDFPIEFTAAMSYIHGSSNFCSAFINKAA
jgi:hypothetical protein